MLSSLLLVTALAVGQGDTAPKLQSPATAAAEKKALADQVKKLVVQLDDDEQARRDAAEQALIALGAGVLDVLPPAGPKASIELKARLNRVRITVEKAYIEAFTKPAVVTVQGKMKLSEAIASIERQSGNTLIDAREDFNQEAENVEVELNVEKVSFWEALDALLDEAGLTVYNYNDKPGQLRLMNATPGDTARSEHGRYSGLFRLEAKQLDATRNLRNPMGNGVNITTDIVWEPRVQPIVLTIPLAELKATDENGEEIVTSGEGDVEVPIESSNAGVEMNLYLKLPNRSSTKIASLKGKFTALMPGRVETFEFSQVDKIKNESIERGGAIVTFEQLRPNDEVHEVRMRVKFDKAANALESHRGWINNNEAFLLDGKGNKIENGGYNPTLVEENEVGISYIFDLTDVKISECRFVYQTPAALFQVPVEFELKDLELP